MRWPTSVSMTWVVSIDIIKDRQYTTKTDSQARHSAQTALYHLVQTFVRWMSPILSFTAQEAWPLIPEQTEKYVFTAEWYDILWLKSKLVVWSRLANADCGEISGK